MSKIIIGSARIDEKGNISGGKAGDQTGKEVSTQNFYESSLGWDILRAVKPEHANRLATAMAKYCADDNVGYDQSNRTAILKYTGTGKTECDCSSLIRRCIIDATKTDVGNFTTATEKSVLTKSGLFKYVGVYTKDTILYTGDILVTRKKGHTVLIISATLRPVPTAPATTKYTVGCTYTINCSLNCRALPDKKSKVLKVYKAGTRVTIKDVKVVDGNTWVKTSIGWCAGVYDGKVRVK